MAGGPMYAMKKGFKVKWLGSLLAFLFSLFAVIASFGIGNLTQANSISDAVQNTFGAVSYTHLVGVSGPGIVTEEMVASMNKDAILFAMANPIPEIMPDLAKKAGARVIGTGRSDFPNQINNVLAFPGIFRGALDARASRITESMKVAAAYAIADLVSAEEPVSYTHLDVYKRQPVS